MGGSKSMILDFMYEMINGFLTDLLNWGLDGIGSLLISYSSLAQYFDYAPYLRATQLIAGGLLPVLILIHVLKSIGGNSLYGQEKSLSTYAIQIIGAAGGIYILPIFLTSILIPINNLFVEVIKSMPVKFSAPMALGAIAQNTGMSLLIILLVLAISYLVLAVMAGIRYVELIIAIIIAPFVSLSFINKAEPLSVWIREVVSITFTQSIHFLLLNIHAMVLGAEMNIFIKITLLIGLLTVMVRGPKLLRQFMYSSGTGNASLSSVGSVSQYAMMRKVFTKV